MISDKNIVCFASGWHYHPTSKHHVMRRLSEHNHVIWVNWHASRCPRIRLDDLRTIGSKLLQIQKGPRQVSSNLTVITPPQIPFPGSSLARRINVALVRRAINRVLSRIPVRPTQFWSFAPDVADLVGSFNEELVLYYCVDAFGEFPGYDRDLIERRERELLARSDVVLATSEPLYEAKKLLHDHVHFIEHGVDHLHLSRAVTEQLSVPADLAALPKPVFGFVGVVGEWVDMELMAGLARKQPNGSVVVIGPVAGPRGSGSHLPNLHWLGPKDHSELPNYLKGFDVGLIPFRKVPLTYHANPIKLYEYLAAGVPVVSTHLPAVRPLPGSVWLADDIAGTVNCCGQATQHNSTEERLRRSQSMQVESWTARLEQISRIVDEIESRRTLSADPPGVPIAVPIAGAAPVPSLCCRPN
ncbi:MAG: glycosyltransferase [Phycisphaerae bacterium]|nr:glycosyltransferase [Phycisphaerae bacterium]